MGNGKGRKARPWRRLRAERKGAKIFLRNPGRAEKDGHFGAHQGGDKRVLTGKSASREWGVVKGRGNSKGEARRSAFGIRKRGRSAEKKEWGGPWVGSRGHRVRIVGPSCSREGGGLRYIDDAMVRNRVENDGGGRRATQVAFAGDSGSAGSWSRRAKLRISHATRKREEHRCRRADIGGMARGRCEGLWGQLAKSKVGDGEPNDRRTRSLGWQHVTSHSSHNGVWHDALAAHRAVWSGPIAHSQSQATSTPIQIQSNRPCGYSLPNNHDVRIGIVECIINIIYCRCCGLALQVW